MPSYAWIGTHGCGKRTQLLSFLTKQAEISQLPFDIKYGTWFLNKPVNKGDPEEDDDPTGKSIPYEESAIHLGFDTATMSMSDKVFLQSILTRWTGQQDLFLMNSTIHTRYLVLYHANLFTDESVLQLQECLEQYPTFSILLTSEFPICGRLRDFCLEIPVAGKDYLLENYTSAAKLCQEDIRNWIYLCLQRNLRWTDVIMYWIQVIYATSWLTKPMRNRLLTVLWNAESSAGWVLVSTLALFRSCIAKGILYPHLSAYVL